MFLVGNGRVITQDKENAYIENGAIVIKDNLILEVGNSEELKNKYVGCEFIDAKGKVIMPGMINSHHHIYSAFARGMSLDGEAGKTFSEVLEKLWWRLDKTLTLEDVKYSAYATYIECIKNGTTTVFDHHASPFAIEGSLFALADVTREIGIRNCSCYEVSDRDGGTTIDAGIKENIDFIKYAQNDSSDMIKGMFGLHAAFTLSDSTLEKCAKEMQGINAGYHVHTAEGIDDLNFNLKTYGKRVVERLNDFGILKDNTIAVHCIHIDENEMDLLKNKKTFVVHNPESNMGNAVGCSPVLQMMKRGITVGLGTDGYTSDMFESMKVANIIHKHVLADPRVAWAETPQMLFENNQRICSKYFNKEVGVLKPGAYADVIIVDYTPYTPLTENNINGHILFGMSGRGVDTTIIGGKVVMKNRCLVSIDEESILAKSREVSSQLWKRI